MRAIILAAGKGTRLAPYTTDIPKAMIQFRGSPVLRHIGATLRHEGVTDLIVVRGHRAEEVRLDGARYVANHEGHNMLYSLLCAESYLEGDVLVSYSDLLYEPRLVRSLVNAPPAPVSVLVDMDWRYYYSLRAEDPEEIAETLGLEGDLIYEIGQPITPGRPVDGQYIGLLRFGAEGCEALRAMYRELRMTHWDKPWRNTRTFQTAYMTDALQELIDRGVGVRAVPVHGGWLEFDNPHDYELAVTSSQDSPLTKHFNPETLPTLTES